MTEMAKEIKTIPQREYLKLHDVYLGDKETLGGGGLDLLCV